MNEWERLRRLETAARSIVEHYPVEIVSNEMEYSSHCFFCGVDETPIPDYEERQARMVDWLNENPPIPTPPAMPVSRKNAPDMREWDRTRNKQLTEYHAKYDAWNQLYLVACKEIWPEQEGVRAGMHFLHKEDCAFRRLKEALDASD